jgi:hypothetical protein
VIIAERLLCLRNATFISNHFLIGMRLYKYVSPERTDVLENGLVRFTQPTSFNDPFETFPYLQSLGNPVQNEDLGDALAEEFVGGLSGRNLPAHTILEQGLSSIEDPELRETLYAPLSDENIEDLRRMTRILKYLETERGADVEQVMEEHLGSDFIANFFRGITDLDPQEYAPEEIDSAVVAKIQALTERASTLLSVGFRQKYGERYGVLTLSEQAKNLLMWSHYASAHRGLLLAFNGDHEFFRRAENSGDEPPWFGQIEYVSEKPSISLDLGEKLNVQERMEKTFQDLSSEGKSSGEAKGESSKAAESDPERIDWLEAALDENARKLLFKKSEHWEYESEWRYVKRLSGHDRKMEKNGEPIYLFEWPSDALEAVVAGCQMQEETCRTLSEILQHEKYKHVDLFRAQRTTEKFGLEYQPASGG